MSELQFVFQGGRVRTIAIAATAGNVITNLTPTANKRWLILRGLIKLIADANAANRQINLSLTDGTNVVQTFAYSIAITASQTKYQQFGEVMFLSDATLGGKYYVGIRPMLLDGDDQLRIAIDAGLAGDSYSGYVVVVEVDL